MRVVSDILESNGSSSMATICGASIALMDAGVPLKAPVAGVAMGLVKEGDAYAILTDIAGAEDHYGDMDFKVAGTKDGITALQMDIKVAGITSQIMREALAQAQRGRLHILGKMEEVITTGREKISDYAPRFYTVQIPVDKIRDLIGPGGKMIRSIVEQTGVKIDVEDSGLVKVASSDQASAAKALQIIGDITATAEVGKTYLGKVTRLADFGAFVENHPGHRRIAAHQRSGGTSHCRCARRIERRRSGAGESAGGGRQPHPVVAQGDSERAAREDGRGGGFLRCRTAVWLRKVRPYRR
jgi:polyribonucleotide nucleotidyltransferase